MGENFFIRHSKYPTKPPKEPWVGLDELGLPAAVAVGEPWVKMCLYFRLRYEKRSTKAMPMIALVTAEYMNASNDSWVSSFFFYLAGNLSLVTLFMDAFFFCPGGRQR